MRENKPIQVTVICDGMIETRNTKAAFVITLDADGDPIVKSIARGCSEADEFMLYAAIRRLTEKIELKKTRFKEVYVEAVGEGLFKEEVDLMRREDHAENQEERTVARADFLF